MNKWHKLGLCLSLTLVLSSEVGCGRRIPVKPPEPTPAPSGSPSAKPTDQPSTPPTTSPPPTTPPSGSPPPSGNPTAAPRPGLPQWNQLPIVPLPPKQPANPDPLAPPPVPTPAPGTPQQPGGGPGTALSFKGAADTAALKWQADAFLTQITGTDMAASGKTQAKSGSYWGYLYYSPSVNQMFSVIAMGNGGISSYSQPNPFGKDTPFYLARLSPWKIDSSTAMATAIASGYKPFTDFATMSLHMLQNTPVWQADGDVSVRVNAVSGTFIARAIQGRWQ